MLHRVRNPIFSLNVRTSTQIETKRTVWQSVDRRGLHQREVHLPAPGDEAIRSKSRPHREVATMTRLLILDGRTLRGSREINQRQLGRIVSDLGCDHCGLGRSLFARFGYHGRGIMLQHDSVLHAAVKGSESGAHDADFITFGLIPNVNKWARICCFY